MTRFDTDAQGNSDTAWKTGPKTGFISQNRFVANVYNIDIKLLITKSSRREYLKKLVSKENTKYGVHQVSVK